MSVPAGVDIGVPSAARMYDYYLGGDNNFPADREAAEKVLGIVPDAPRLARENRAFLIRSIDYLASRQVRQFLDIGAGLPTQRNVHEVAADAIPDARTVYIDHDPSALLHGQALLAATPEALMIDGDLRSPEEILAHPDVRAHLDLSEPYAILLLAVLHFIPDDTHVSAIIARLREALPPGGYLVISHAFTGEEPEDLARERVRTADRIYATTPSGGFTTRTRGHLAGYFDGMELIGPGIVPVESWRPDHAVDPDFTRPGGLCAVGRAL